MVGRNNRSPEDLAKTMLNETLLLKYFWVDAVNTTSYILNRVLIRLILKKTTYELFKGRRFVLESSKGFCCKCFILNNGKEKLGKIYSKIDE